MGRRSARFFQYFLERTSYGWMDDVARTLPLEVFLQIFMATSCGAKEKKGDHETTESWGEGNWEMVCIVYELRINTNIQIYECIRILRIGFYLDSSRARR